MEMAHVFASPTSPGPFASYVPTPISLAQTATEVSDHWGAPPAQLQPCPSVVETLCVLPQLVSVYTVAATTDLT